jgi:hypothetical protein
MAYNTPKHWVYGDEPDATEFNKYSGNLSAILAAYDGKNWVNNGRMYQDVDLENEDFAFIHQNMHRWLVYRADANPQLVSWLDVNDTYGLQATEDDEWAILDLEQVDWLAPGLLYKVEGCICAHETEYLQ